MDDPRFNYGPVPNWRTKGKQTVLSTFVTELEDNNVFDPHPIQLEWALDTKNPILFDRLTKFYVEVSILVSTKEDDTPAVVGVAGGAGGVGAVEARAAVPGEWGEYTDCEAAEYRNFMLAPVWLEKFWKIWQSFHENDQPKQHDESWYVPYELNTLLYWMMGKELKDELCPELWHPGRAVPTATKKWTFDENSAWHDYSKQLLTGQAMGFTYTLLHFFPVFQGTNHYVQEGFRPRALPVPYTGKLLLRAKPVDKFDNVIKIAPGVNNKRYKLVITKMKLCVEEARISDAEKRLLQNKSKTLHFPGICKMMRNETISAGAFIHSVRFEEVVFPEIILIFALHKNVTGGSYKYQTHTTGQPHFLQHNLEQVNVSYANFTMSMSVPDFGTVNSVHAERHLVRAYRQLGIFGMQVDPDVVNNVSADNGFKNTDFPHVALHLVQTNGLETGQPRTRTVPLLTGPEVLAGKPKELLLNFKFNNPEGSPADASFIIYLGYTDTCMVYKDKKFSSPYGLY